MISLPSAAFSQDDAGQIESFDGEGIEAPQSENLGTLEDYRWTPVGIGRTFDFLVVRPAAIALLGISTLTFSVAAAWPVIRGNRERTSALYQGLLVEPFKYAFLRPPYSAPDHFVLLQEEREAEEALAAEALETAAKEAAEARAKAEAGE